MVRTLYNFILYSIILPLLPFKLIRQGLKNKAYFEHLKEHFGFVKPVTSQGNIWIHSASLGETIAIIPMVNQLLNTYPKQHIVMTQMTPTGRAKALDVFKDHPRISICYAPYDFPGSVKRFIKKAKPKLLVLVEAELWPNILHYCTKNNIKTILANARLSPRSFKGYQRWHTIIQPILKQLNYIAAQSTTDARRFEQLGIDPSRISVTGNLKYDIQLPATLNQQATKLRKDWQLSDRPVWTVASTHTGEDQIILQAYANIKQQHPNLLLILVPRHPERFRPVTKLAATQFNTLTFSSSKACCPETDIMIGDTVGQLLLFYALSDIAFVGGSLTPIGGHNVIEPAALGKPIIIGPHYVNFQQIVETLLKSDAIKVINNQDQLVTTVDELLVNLEQRQTLGKHAKQVIKENHGALNKQLDCINQLLSD